MGSTIIGGIIIGVILSIFLKKNFFRDHLILGTLFFIADIIILSTFWFLKIDIGWFTLPLVGILSITIGERIGAIISSLLSEIRP